MTAFVECSSSRTYLRGYSYSDRVVLFRDIWLTFTPCVELLKRMIISGFFVPRFLLHQQWMTLQQSVSPCSPPPESQYYTVRPSVRSFPSFFGQFISERKKVVFITRKIRSRSDFFLRWKHLVCISRSAKRRLDTDKSYYHTQSSEKHVCLSAIPFDHKRPIH